MPDHSSLPLPDWRTSRALAHPGCHFHLCALCAGAISGFYDYPCPAWDNADHVHGVCYDCWQFVKADAVIETAVGSCRREAIHTLERRPAAREAVRQHLLQRSTAAKTDTERAHWQQRMA